jgi:hypothetical protein
MSIDQHLIIYVRLFFSFSFFFSFSASLLKFFYTRSQGLNRRTKINLPQAPIKAEKNPKKKKKKKKDGNPSSKSRRQMRT